MDEGSPMSGGIDAVRARLQRDLSLRLIHRDTAGDVQALLDHHAKLQAASSDVVLAVDVAMAALEPWLDHGSDEDAPQMACEALAEGFRKAGLFTADTAECLTCSGHGLIGSAAADGGAGYGQDCPDCTDQPCPKCEDEICQEQAQNSKGEGVGNG